MNGKMPARMAAAARATHAQMSAAAREAAPTGQQLVERLETALAGSGAQGDGDRGDTLPPEGPAAHLRNALQIIRTGEVPFSAEMDAIERHIVNALELIERGGRS